MKSIQFRIFALFVVGIIILGVSITTSFADKEIATSELEKKAIYILPGFLGSELYYTKNGSDELLWVKLGTIDPLEQIKLINPHQDGSEGEVSPFYVLGKDITPYGKDDYGASNHYKELVDRLKSEFSSTYDVKFFPFNWLGDLNAELAKLELDINANRYNKVVFVTHSTGGLLASAYIAKSKTNQSKIEKAVLIAPPLFGTYASLYPLENGSIGKLDFIKIKDFAANFATSNTLIKNIMHNAPTPYQLLPSKEYFASTRALDLRYAYYYAGTGIPPSYACVEIPWNSFYMMLVTSPNLNHELLNYQYNSRTHKNFREKSVVTNGTGSIVDTLRRVDVTLIGTMYGFMTPMTAQYSLINDSYCFFDMIYNESGDGTVFSSSHGVALDKNHDVETNLLPVIDAKNLFTKGSAKTPNHGKLIKSEQVIEEVISLINKSAKAKSSSINKSNNISAKSISLHSLEGEGMSAYIKIRVESPQQIITKVFDAQNNEVAYSDGENESGFDGEDFICDQFGDGGETLTSIYMPKSGYVVRFYCGDSPNTPVEAYVTVNLLDPDGNVTGFGFYATDSTVGGGETLSLDLTNGVSENNIGSLASVSNYPSLKISTETFATDWKLDFSYVKKPADVVTLDNIGDTATVGVIGNVNLDVIEWSSDDESVVTVDKGVLTAVGHGRAIVSAYSTDGSGKSEKFHVKVVLISSSVKFQDITLGAGERDLICPEFDSDLVTEVKIDYAYDERAGVIIIDDDVVFALAGGEIEVTGTAVGDATGKFKVKVEGDPPVPAQSISVTPVNSNIAIDETVELIVEIYPEEATNKWFDWEFADDSSVESIMTVGNSCEFLGIKEGVTEITVRSRDGGFTAKATINVGPTNSAPATASSAAPATTAPYATNAPVIYNTPYYPIPTIYNAPYYPIPTHRLEPTVSSMIELTLTIGEKTYTMKNGASVGTLDVAPYIDAATNRTMLPLRFVSEVLGARVDWERYDATDVKVTFTLDGKTATLITGRDLGADANGNSFGSSYLDPTADRTFVPIRYIAEKLDATVDWDEKTRQVKIYK
jgi:uncharacterized protein YjdB/pimeloyl-ACP methyl ester carboxylesterase